MNEQLMEKSALKGLTEYVMEGPDDLFDIVEGGTEATIRILKKMKPNQYYVTQTMPAMNINTSSFQEYIGELKSNGINIGKGDCEYGYKMPLAERGESRRGLIIFRRRIEQNE